MAAPLDLSPPEIVAQPRQPEDGDPVEDHLTDPVDRQRTADREDHESPRHAGDDAAGYDGESTPIIPARTRRPSDEEEEDRTDPGNPGDQGRLEGDGRDRPESHQDQDAPGQTEQEGERSHQPGIRRRPA